MQSSPHTILSQVSTKKHQTKNKPKPYCNLSLSLVIKAKNQPMHNNPISVFTLLCSIILICHKNYLRISVHGGKIPATPDYLGSGGAVAISCGATGNSIGLDGRQWIGDTGLSILQQPPKAKSRSSSIAAEKSISADRVPYMTSRISANQFCYSFQVNPGQKFIRLHFYPISYLGFEKSRDFFTVKAGSFTLLGNFSASLAAEASGENYIVKEYCLNVEEHGKLELIFFPIQSSKSNDDKTHAFINGIEIISMPDGLYFTPNGGDGARVVGRNYFVHIEDDTTALEMIQRLNIGGNSISSVEDFGMFRRWYEDTNFLLFESLVHSSSNRAHVMNKSTSIPPYIAPLKLYQTSWKAGRGMPRSEMYSFTWKIPVDQGFAYLVRLHFCEFNPKMPEDGLTEFRILINNQIAEDRANVIRWSGGTGIPVFRDYMVMMKGGKEEGKHDLLIVLQSADELVVGLLHGLEIFKLSNLENSLASPNPVFGKQVATSLTLKIKYILTVLGQRNAIPTSMTILIIFLSVIFYNLRQFCEKDIHEEKDMGSPSTEPSHRNFSLSEIKSATQNFSDAFIIGKGGFGKVYKGSISGISENLAIKRLNSNSMQGAREFWSEIETLSKLRHIHLVPLIGHCNEDQEMILVYKYMPRGTLADNLYKIGRNNNDYVPLSWMQRLRICIGAARGLDYLHTGTDYGVIHRDVKDSNILLDENFTAKISDFGLSKLEQISQSKSYVSTNVKGTMGYLDPDYLATHKLTRKSDVYAFGVVMLVVLSGRPVLDTRISGDSRSLLSCFRDCITKGQFEDIVDPYLQGKISSESLKEFLKSIEKCLQHRPKKRPTMAQLIVSLEEALERQERTMFPTSEKEIGTTQSFHFNQGGLPPINEECVISLPKEGIASKTKPNANLTTKGKKMQSREKDSVRNRKPLWGWPWEILRSRRKPLKKKDSIPANGPCHRYSITDIQEATDNFRVELILLHDKYKVVYMGQIQFEDWITIHRYKTEVRNEEFLEIVNEIEMLTQLTHTNLVRLTGYCYHKNEMFLYDYAQSFTLYNHLYDPDTIFLSWKDRLKICTAAARGLDYLHEGTGQTQPIIHRDMRLESIMLDKNSVPKILNFGLSKLCPAAQFASRRIHSSCSEYLSPDVIIQSLKLTKKSDVYSFGLVLLEVLCCHRRIDFPLTVDVAGRYLHHWVKTSIKTRALHHVIDPNLKEEIATTSLTEFLRIAFRCLLLQANERPTIAIVAKRLEAALQLQENAETAKQDIGGDSSGFRLEDIYDIPDIAPDELFKISSSQPDEEDFGISQQIIDSSDSLQDTMVYI
ncbi:hypothetical protein ACH5RR_016450 [Cinchona calisaya]|uniref:Protein kinase domain-containing protein n=1 Tax=Cinchona calisaya TaxID=153742 RepID=A0ABD2ZY23_9GENT